MTEIASNLTATQIDNQRLRQTAQAFEAIFLRDMIKSMRSASLGNDLLSNSGEIQFRDMMDGRLANDMSAREGGIGIAEMLVTQWEDKL